MTTARIDQDQFDWVEGDDRFDLGLCLTLVSTDDLDQVLDVFDGVNARRSRRPADASMADWLDSVDDDSMAMRHAGRRGGWTWVLEEFAIDGAMSILPERLSEQFGRCVNLHWDVNMLSQFLLAVDGVVERRFELGREADPSDRGGLEGYLDEEEGLDWEQPLSAGACLQARVAGVVVLTENPVEPEVSETCNEA